AVFQRGAPERAPRGARRGDAVRRDGHPGEPRRRSRRARGAPRRAGRRGGARGRARALARRPRARGAPLPARPRARERVRHREDGRRLLAALHRARAPGALAARRLGARRARGARGRADLGARRALGSHGLFLVSRSTIPGPLGSGGAAPFESPLTAFDGGTFPVDTGVGLITTAAFFRSSANSSSLRGWLTRLLSTLRSLPRTIDSNE